MDTCKLFRQRKLVNSPGRATIGFHRCNNTSPDFSNAPSNYASRQLARSFIFFLSLRATEEPSPCKLHASTFNHFDCVYVPACNFLVNLDASCRQRRGRLRKSFSVLASLLACSVSRKRKNDQERKREREREGGRKKVYHVWRNARVNNYTDDLSRRDIVS